MGTEEIIRIKTEVDSKGLEQGLLKMQEAAAKGAKAVSGELVATYRSMELLAKESRQTETAMVQSMAKAEKAVAKIQPEAVVKGFQTLVGAADKGVDAMLKVNDMQTAWSEAAEEVNKLRNAQTLMATAGSGGLTVLQTGVAVLTGQIGLQTAATGLAAKAQGGLNAVMNLNPIFLGGAALVAIFAVALGEMNLSPQLMGAAMAALIVSAIGKMKEKSDFTVAVIHRL